MRLLMVALGLGAVLLMQPSAASACPQGEQESTVKKTQQGSVQAVPQTRDAQQARAGRDTAASQGEFAETRLDTSLVKKLVADQKSIWTSPARLRFADSTWLVPLAGLTAGLLVTDRQFSKHLSNDPQTLRRYRKASDYGAATLVGATGGLYLWGKIAHEDHRRETGILAGEALLNSLAVTQTFKFAAGRSRPFENDGSGRFRQGGTSFPSEHATAAWAMAGVIAHEYPGPLTKLLAYGMASAVSFSRVKAKEHFPSDVLIGSAIGWFIGQQVYRAHHDPELGGGTWETFSELTGGESRRQPKNMGSPYVPLDSWVYPALERLAALGYIHTEFLGMRPWTRLECARLVSEAEGRFAEEEVDAPEPSRLYRPLAEGFAPDLALLGGGRNRKLRVESVYTRFTGIAGTPLRDGYHFGQTIINDFGRPYAEGANVVTGFSGWAAAGRFTAYVRGEYQHAPSAPALPEGARQFIAAADGLPSAPPSTRFSDVNRFRLLDAYVAMNLENWQVSFGKQSLSWGPGDGGPMLFSNNAEPINMFRINRVSPFQLPSLLKRLGPVRTEFFIGQLDGHHFVDTPSGITGSWSQPLNPQPFIDGWKLSFKPTPNFELGLTYTTIFGGVGIPATPRTFVQSLFDAGGDLPDGSSKSSRFTGLDFSYRIPKLRKWLTLYGDGFTHDQVIFLPYGYPERAVWRAGIYVPMFPGIRKLDFRAEGGYTNNPLGGYLSQGFYYTANRYLNGDTHNGNLLGSWLGRAGQGMQAWTNYWFNARNRIQLNFRHQKVGQQFLPGGGSLTDVGVRGDYWLRPGIGLSAWVQHERWLIPVIQPNAQRNVTAAAQILFEPQKLFQRSAANAMATTSGTGDRP